jgi:hypothetical protein
VNNTKASLGKIVYTYQEEDSLKMNRRIRNAARANEDYAEQLKYHFTWKAVQEDQYETMQSSWPVPQRKVRAETEF